MFASIRQELNMRAYEYAKEMQPRISSIFDMYFGDSMLKTFAYFRFFEDGSYIYLCNKIDWVRFCIENVTTNDNATLGDQVKSLNNDNMSFYLWPDKVRGFVFDAMYEHNIWNGLSVFSKNEHSIELWGFAGDRSNDFDEGFYFDNIETIKKFILNFNLKAGDIISPGIAKRAYYESYVSQDSDTCYIDAPDELTLIPKKVPILVKNNEIFVSNKEYNILKSLAVNRTIKEISNNVHIGTKAVEYHLRNLKEKLKCGSNHDLVEMYLNTKGAWV